ncbi:hypothetical protein RJT34_30657 [Clitoria ternatea]|uniref:Polyneuridine-aldehyde esterase n=1 Tax=Clitoria ternatea TaxID=43366 RepID=A0AAN9F0N3_CLITE
MLNIQPLNTQSLDIQQIIWFGPKFLSEKLYQASPIKYLELAKTLIRQGSLFTEDLSQQKILSKEGYGPAPRAFIICTEDQALVLKHQLWMIQNAGIDDIVEIKGADHMAMLSKPQELCDSLLHIASNCA